MMVVPVETLISRLNDLNLNITFENNYYTIETTICDKNIQLTCLLPESFPYVFPTVFISEASKRSLGRIPHINTDLSLCLFDAEIVIPNFNNPVGLIEETIRKAIRVLEDGASGKNHIDISKEFNAYWNSKADRTFFSNVVFGNIPLNLHLFTGKYGNYISYTHDDCIHIAKSRFEIVQDASTIDCIYIPLSSHCFDDRMLTQRDWANIIRTRSEHYGTYAKFIQGRTSEKSLIIFSQPIDNTLVISGFLHKRIHSINGFRKGKTPLGLALSQKDGDELIEHIEVIDVSQERLFSRGGIGAISMVNQIGVVGCGSLGSNLVKTLSDCGYSRFRLYDNQCLTAENIARHVCGFSDIGFPKTTALKNILISHNPNIFVDTFNDDIHTILNSNLDSLNQNDLLVLTVANAPIEFRFVSEYISGNIKVPVIIMWVEPFGMAAHALILNKPQNVYSELFSPSLSFLDSVVLNGDSYYKHEVGCQSTFMPYSGLDVQAFCITFVKHLIRGAFATGKNFHFLWTGELSNAKQYNITLSQKASSLQDFHTYIERID